MSAERGNARTLTHEQARRVYDRIGRRQDSQAFYEDRAVAVLVEHGDFRSAQRLFEFGCGTGRFACRLLADYLPQTAVYRGVDLSPAMVGLARRRLERFGSRAEVILTDGSPPTGEPAAAYDRFVSNFVLDLLSEDDIAAVVREAQRMLAPGGLLCVASLSTGKGGFSRLMSNVWTRVHALRPALVGGCRPIELLDWLLEPSWQIRHHAQLAPFGFACEAVVAERG